MKWPRFSSAVVACFLACQAFALFQDDAAHPKRLRIKPKVAAELMWRIVAPEYPESAVADHVSGDVFLHIVIDRQGKVIEAAPVSRDEWPPTPALSEDPRLVDAAIQAVRQWEYKPYLFDGQFVEVETQVIVKFQSKPVEHAGGGVIGGVRQGGVIGGIVGSGAPPPKVEQPPHVRVSSEAMENNLLKHVDPVYPSLARTARIQGEVRLYAVVDKTGVLTNLRAVSGHPILLQAAMDAVRHWEYKPFLLDGEPVIVEGLVIVLFKL